MDAPSLDLSMQEALMRPLERLNTLAETLFRSLGPSTGTKNAPLPPPLTEFLQCDADLAAALHEARIHQAKQREIDKLTLEILGLESQLRDVILSLAKGKEELEDMISEGDDVLERIALASQHSVSHKTILSYASNLAKFTSAPPSDEPLRPESVFDGTIIPPFPTVEMMRRGKMNFEAPLGSLGETREVGRTFSPSLVHAQADNQAHLPHGGPTQYSTYAAAQQQAASGSNLDDLFDLDLNPDF